MKISAIESKTPRVSKGIFGFTMLEVMIVAATIATLASISVPAYERMRKHSQALMVREDLRIIDDAVNDYATENNKPSGTAVVFESIKSYIKRNSSLYDTGADLFGNPYGPTFSVSTPPHPPVATYEALSDVISPDFWSPYNMP